jgi:hypothetical protein
MVCETGIGATFLRGDERATAEFTQVNFGAPQQFNNHGDAESGVRLSSERTACGRPHCAGHTTLPVTKGTHPWAHEIRDGFRAGYSVEHCQAHSLRHLPQPVIDPSHEMGDRKAKCIAGPDISQRCSAGGSISFIPRGMGGLVTTMGWTISVRGRRAPCDPLGLSCEGRHA